MTEGITTSINIINSLIDTGPLSGFALDKVCQKHSVTSLPPIYKLLPFFGEGKYLSSEVLDLVDSFKLHNRQDKKSVEVITSVASWIFHTNKIEYAGVSSLGETLEIITNKEKDKTSKGYKDVVNTFLLLKSTYKGEGTLEDQFLEPNEIIKAHETLFEGSGEEIGGKIRTAGVFAINQDKSKHFFPHHSLVDRFLAILSLITKRLSMYIDKMESRQEKILYAFALAAFAQFHFVDLHPFKDGNGRMCRFISKKILDSFLPLPFPMFVDRDSYIRSIEDGRKMKDCEYAPQPLFLLLLKTAIQHYKEVFSRLSLNSHDIRAAADSNEYLIKKINGTANEKEVDECIMHFEKLSINETKEFTLSSGRTCQLRKFLIIDEI